MVGVYKMIEKFKKLLKTINETEEKLNNLITEIEDVPDHFGGGKNIDIFGYKTKNFDICQGAVVLFEKLLGAEKQETQKLIEAAAEPLDNMFGIEKRVVDSGKATQEDVSEATKLVNDFSMKLGAISEKMQQDYKEDAGFLKMHLEEIIKRMDPKDIQELDEAWSKKERANRKSKCDNPKGFTMKQFCKNQSSRSKKGEKKNESIDTETLEHLIREHLEEYLEEKRGRKKKKKGDRCTRIAKRKYKAWPSAYASGAVVRCRRGKIWKGLKEDFTDEQLAENQEYEKGLDAKIRKALEDEGGAAGMDALEKRTEASAEDIKAAIKEMDDVGRHKDGDYILDDNKEVQIVDEETLEEKKKKAKSDFSLEKKKGLAGWFSRRGDGEGGGEWVDCNTCRKDPKTGRKKCKSCGRKEGEKRAKYPRCRPTPSQCKGYKRRGDNLKKESVIEEIEYNYIHPSDATYDDGNAIDFILEFWDDVIVEAEYRGRKVTLNKPTRGDVKKFKVYVKDPKTGNIKKVNFGDPNMRIKKSNPKRRKSFRARHNCDNPGPKTKARYWSCRKW